MNTLNLSEIFLSVQGEGMHTGVPSIFVRLNGCNLCCSFGNPKDGICRSLCDTPFTSINPDKASHTSISELTSQLIEQLSQVPGRCDIVITGGEPMLQQAGVETLIQKIEEDGFYPQYTIETNGTIMPSDKLLADSEVFWSVSPKLISSCCFLGSQISEARRRAHQDKRINLRALARIVLTDRYQLKFVYSGEESVEEIKQILKDIKLCAKEELGDWAWKELQWIFNCMDEHVLLMPEGSTREQLEVTSQAAVEAAIKNGWRYCDRTHIRVWDNKRGV